MVFRFASGTPSASATTRTGCTVSEAFSPTLAGPEDAVGKCRLNDAVVADGDRQSSLTILPRQSIAVSATALPLPSLGRQLRQLLGALHIVRRQGWRGNQHSPKRSDLCAPGVGQDVCMGQERLES